MAGCDRRCKRLGFSVGTPNEGPGKKEAKFRDLFGNHVTVGLLRAFLIDPRAIELPF
jgi:hypothetical protein